MTRYHAELAIIHRRVREWMRLSSSGQRGEASPFPPGRYLKRKPLDCGRARCYTCSAMKLMAVPTVQELRDRVTVKEQLQEDRT